MTETDPAGKDDEKMKATYFPPSSDMEPPVLRMTPCYHCKKEHAMVVHTLEFATTIGGRTYSFWARCDESDMVYTMDIEGNKVHILPEKH